VRRRVIALGGTARLKRFVQIVVLAGPSGLLLALLLAALGIVAMFSIGLEQTSPIPAVSRLNGESTSFTLDLWHVVLGGSASLKLAGATLTMPPGVALAIVVGLFLAVFTKRAGRLRWVAAAALLVPFLTIPTGTRLLRVAEWTAGSPDLRLFFKSASLATTAGVAATAVAIPVAFFLAFGAPSDKASGSPLCCFPSSPASCSESSRGAYCSAAMV
jgi:ABC-type spermidine/putrescine transport system permease subunit I